MRSRRWVACAVDSNELFIENSNSNLADRIGEKGQGFEYILHGMNPERILIAKPRRSGSACWRSSAPRLMRRERVVFNRPIGTNQAIQHPLAGQRTGSS